MKFDRDITPFARVFLLDTETIYPGWYIRYYVEGRLLTEPLEISNEAEVLEAVTEAAGYLGCSRDEVQIEVPKGIDLPISV